MIRALSGTRSLFAEIFGGNAGPAAEVTDMALTITVTVAALISCVRLRPSAASALLMAAGDGEEGCQRGRMGGVILKVWMS